MIEQEQSEVRKFPYGVCMPFSTLLMMRSGHPWGMYRTQDIYPDLFSTLLPSLIGVGCRPFESTLSDIVEFADKQESLAPISTRLFPWRFAPEVRDIKLRSQSSPSHSLEWTNAVMDTFLTGSDFDGRLDMDPSETMTFARELVQRTQADLGITNRHTQITSPDNHTLFARLRDENSIVSCLPRPDITRLSGLVTDMNHTPTIIIQAGKWGNGIPYVYWGIDAEPNYDFSYPSTPIFRAGFAPLRSRLPEKLQILDTRTGPGINSWDRQLGLLSNILPNKFDHDNLPHLPHDMWNPHFSLDHTTGLISPAMGGIWTDNADKFLIPWTTGEKVGTETFITLSSDTAEALTHPNNLGSEFLQLPATQAFQEFIRWMRKSLRYGIDIKVEDQNASLIDGSYRRNGQTLFEELHTHGEEDRGELKLAIAKEMLVMMFFAPKELIEYGNRFRFSQYFPQWKLIEGLASALPERGTVREALLKDASLQLKSPADGIHLLVDLLKKQDPERFGGINTLEIGAWLCEMS